MEGVDPTKVVVCDNGTGFIKAGYAGENFPRQQFPSMIGTPVLRDGCDVGTDRKYLPSGEEVRLDMNMVGDKAALWLEALDIRYPMDNGVVTNWDAMKQVWDYLFLEKMKVDPREKYVLLTEPAANPDRCRKKSIEVMFEHYQFEGMTLSLQAMLTLYAQGLITGVVLDTGDGVTHSIPVYEGFCPRHLIKRLDVAGRHVTDYLIKLLQGRGYAFNKTADRDIVRRIKEEKCYVAYDFEREKKLASETTVLVERYRLPDGSEIKIGSERFRAPEILFTPSLIDIEKPGMADMVYNMIQEADMDTRNAYFKHIVLSGGSSMYPGLSTRLQKDIIHRWLEDRELASMPTKIKIRVEDPPRRQTSVFQGASVLGEIMKDRDDFWLTRTDYEEDGLSRTFAKLKGTN